MQCCKDRNSFESDGWKKDDIKLRGAVETIQYVGSNGEVRFIRVPSGRAHEVLERAVLDGSLDAKEAIKWQDEKVPPKVLLGISLDLVEALLRYMPAHQIYMLQQFDLAQELGCRTGSPYTVSPCL